MPMQDGGYIGIIPQTALTEIANLPVTTNVISTDDLIVNSGPRSRVSQFVFAGLPYVYGTMRVGGLGEGIDGDYVPTGFANGLQVFNLVGTDPVKSALSFDAGTWSFYDPDGIAVTTSGNGPNNPADATGWDIPTTTITELPPPARRSAWRASRSLTTMFTLGTARMRMRRRGHRACTRTSDRTPTATTSQVPAYLRQPFPLRALAK